MGDIRTTTGEKAPIPIKDAKKARNKCLLITAMVITAVLIMGFIIRIPRYTVASGYVTTRDWAEVRPPVSGVVKRILVKTGQQVKAGQVMVELNDEIEVANLSEAKTQLERLNASREKRKAEMAIDIDRRTVILNEDKRVNLDAISRARLELENAETKLKLTTELVGKGLKAASNLDDDRVKTELARLNLKSLHAKAKSFKPFEELIRKDRAKYDQELAANLKEIQAQADRVRRLEAVVATRKIRAPIDGEVVRYTFVPGELVQPTSVLYEIFHGRIQLKLRINERHATKVAVGQHYRAELSSYQGIRNFYFYGKIEYLRGVIQSDGATSYRVAYCSFEPRGYRIPMGTTCEARIYYDRSAFWLYLFNLDW